MLLLWIFGGIILFLLCLRFGILGFFIEAICDLIGGDDHDDSGSGGFGGGSFGGGGSSDSY